MHISIVEKIILDAVIVKALKKTKCYTRKHDIFVPYGLFMWGYPDGSHRTALISWHMLGLFVKARDNYVSIGMGTIMYTAAI